VLECTLKAGNGEQNPGWSENVQEESALPGSRGSVPRSSDAANNQPTLMKLDEQDQTQGSEMIETSDHSHGLSLPDCLIQDLFIDQAVQAPDRPAVITRTRTLSYGELLSLSRAWGRRLRDLGAKPNTLVAVVMEKGWEQIVAVLSILESGAAYLPVDTNVPTERLWCLLENGGVQMVLTQSWLDARLQWPTHVTRLSVDTEGAVARRSTPLDHIQSPDDLAYVLYTSGSTGMPKGAMIAHRGVVNCILDTNRSFQISPEDRALAVTALHHDMSVYDIFGLLAAGGAIVMPDQATARAPDHWIDLIDCHRVSVWNSVPAFMEMLLEHAAEQNLRRHGRLRLAFLGGDWIPLSAPDRIRKYFGDVLVVSVGGPTETTVWNIWYPVRNLDPGWKSIPYGHGIANTRYYVLDENFQDCPAGAEGELCCAGVGLMKGYWRDEELTRQRFAVHPRTGERIYRTGDRGRLRPDGEIEFVGRIDTQVKIRGLRIELGEIEAALKQHASVEAAVVVVREDTPGDKRLVAYVVPRPGHSIGTGELRGFLKRQLPDYMVPAKVEFLDALPLTPNGKVDRRALPAPKGSRQELAEEAFAPHNEVEEQLARIFAEVLGLQRMGVEEDFFDSGGNSLLALKLIARVEKALGRRISLATLLEAPTVRELAGLVSGRQSPRSVPGVAPIQWGGSRPAFFCVGAGPLHRRLASLLGPDQPYMGIDLDQAEYKTLAWPFKIEDAASILVKKTRELQPAGPYFLGGECSHGVVAYEMARQIQEAGDEVRLVVLLDAGNPARASSYLKEIKERGLWGRVSVLGRRVENALANLRRMGLPGFVVYAGQHVKYELQQTKAEWNLYRLRRKTAARPAETEVDLINFEYLAMPGYRPRPYSGHVALIRRPVPPEHLYLDADIGWAEVVNGTLEIRFVSGVFDDLFKDPHVNVTARVLKEILIDAQAAGAENHLEAATRP
jgi:pyochelin synthetase